MNFYTIRYTILVTLMLLIFIILVILFKKQEINKKIIAIFIIYFILYKIIFSFIPETKFLTFDSIEKAMQYSFPSNKIFKQINNNGCIFVEYGKDEHSVKYTYFTEKDEKIEFKNPKEIDDIRIFSYNYKTGIVIKTENEQILVALNVTDLKEKREEIKINDSINSKFNSIISEDELGYRTFYYTILNGVPNDYYWIINDRTVEVLKYIK